MSAKADKRHGIRQSMTGYGRATKRMTLGSITVELRSTNHRYLEIDQRLPNGLTALQGRLAELIRGQLRRGRVEVSVLVQLDRWNHQRIAFNEELLQRYHEALVGLKGRFGLKGGVTLDHLLALPHALTVVEERLPAEQMWEPIRRTLQAALEELVRSRRREGAKLIADVRAQLHLLENHAGAIHRRLPEALEQQQRHLQRRLRELLGADGPRSGAQLEQAAALVKEADIHEELVRIKSHLAYVRETLSGNPLVGKRLDFIAQELMRETNTLGAKVNDSEAAQHVVEMKGCIERIREQVQNLE